MKTFTCKSNNSNWMRSHERSFLSITSPSGNTINIRKVKMSNFSDEERKLVWKCIDDEMVKNTSYNVQLSKEEMEMLLKMSKS